MHIHSLDITAFGAYADHVHLDMDTLSEEGVFLLTGSTGSGKTTILDAITFALFGAVPGSREAKDLATHHPSTRKPSVTLEFTLAAQRFRILRSPSHIGPKAGARAADARLQEFDGRGWVDRETKPKDVNLRVRELLGMDLNQFCSVALLAQGEFSRFLTSSSSEREGLLKKLFDVGVYDNLTTVLDTWRTQAGRQEDAATAAVNTDLIKMVQAFEGVSDLVALHADLAHPSVDDDDAVLQWATQHALQVSSAVTRHQARLTEATRERAAAADDVETAARLDADLKRYIDARQTLDRLQEDAPQRAARHSELQLAREASTAAGLLEAADDARSALQACRAKADRSTESLVALDCAPADLGVDGINQALLDAGVLRVEADDRVDVIVQLANLRATLEQSERLRDDAVAALTESTALRASLPVQHSELTEAQQRARELAATLPALRTALDAASAQVAAAQQVDTLTAQRSQLDEARRAAVDAAHAAIDLRDTLRTRRLAGMAAELAAHLAPDASCPVCGALEHPAPAVAPQGGLVTVEAEQIAYGAVTSTGLVRTEAERLLAQCDLALAEARALSFGLTPTDAQKAVDGARQAVTQAESALTVVADLTAQLAVCQASLDSTDADLEALGAAVSKAQRDVAASQARHDSTLTRLQELTAATGPHLTGPHLTGTDLTGTDLTGTDLTGTDLTGTDLTVARAAARTLQAREHALAQALESVRAAATAAQVHQQAAERLHRACAATTLSTPDAARAALRTAVQMGDLENALRLANDAEAAATAVLAEPAIMAVADRQKPQVDALLAVREAAEAALDLATRHLARVKAADTQLTELGSLLATHLQVRRPLRTHSRTIARLADLAKGNGGGEFKMSLTSYVLAARLEQVAAAASLRLGGMTEGRYELLHAARGADGRQKAGLDLVVADSWSGRQRPTGSLSGGETFLASLALALGLADIVSAEAGGVELGTLFVDEGFGSLDTEALDLALDVIDSLRSHGRTVGLVSHVDAMRERITARIEVTKGARGSTLRQVPAPRANAGVGASPAGTSAQAAAA